MKTAEHSQHQYRPSELEPELLSRLASEGYAITDQRRTLVGRILASSRCFTANELIDDLRCEDLKVGRATVFRTLELLVRFGYLSRVPDGERRGYAVCDPGHHHHLVCSGCGRVLHLEDCPVADLLRELESRTGYRIESHQLEVAGVCPSCQDRPQGLSGSSPELSDSFPESDDSPS